ncbi:hypothetical protein DLE60_23790 [Micromonospora globispora]|uniref:Uncharacterized protein n=1 Tax=Micromonospora globispora TaxID=1450148 RepID=A0A317JTV8_9ACTN|nr:hypothetical protein [Micromonospora globispora]PWU44231.1 hypothetical protein DLJ46_27130 [Micromonospora globispora]PWU57798.1 hypothetical protein DLE60_23790 [Micromonospora globispora]RQW83942.1 hypothetical protein DKL51_31075 [Micromonospora globispora]
MTEDVDPVHRRVIAVAALLAMCSVACLVDAAAALSRLARIGAVAPALRAAADDTQDPEAIITTVRSHMVFNAAVGGA